MKLMEFLAVGKSLKPFRDSPSPYTMKQPILTPKFGGKTCAATERDCSESMPAGMPALPSQDPAEETEAVQPQSLGTKRKPEELRGWTGFRRKLGFREKTGEGLVQTELSLESVKVVRNDLSDGFQPLAPKRAKAKSAGHWWERLFARVRKQD